MTETENNLAPMRASDASFPHVQDGWTDRAIRFRPPFVEQFTAIVRGGPFSNAGGSDYADARYFIDRAIPAPASISNGPLSAAIDTLSGVRETITATNLAEVTNGTHLLAPGTLVQVFALYARGGSGAKVHVFNQSPMLAVVVQITSSAAAGEYNGRIVGGAASASSAAPFTMPSGMSIPSADNALILNLEESGLSGHRLTNSSYAVGIVRGMTADSPPRSIVVIRGGLGRTDSPTTLGGTSGSESADTTTWSKATDGTPVNVYVVGRVVYNAAGDQTLYSFVRMLSFDVRGLLVNIGAETRVTVDVTEACS